MEMNDVTPLIRKHNKKIHSPC